jgi:hypothetical protein
MFMQVGSCWVTGHATSLARAAWIGPALADAEVAAPMSVNPWQDLTRPMTGSGE